MTSGAASAMRGRPAARIRSLKTLMPAASNAANPSTTSGVARAVLRNARPNVDDFANDLNAAPTTDGWSYGAAPTEMATPTTMRITQYSRYRQRTLAAASIAIAGMRRLTRTTKAVWVNLNTA